MPVSKIKNLIILILGVSVLALLLLVVPSRVEQAQSEHALHLRMEELFSSYDIDLDAERLPSSVRLYAIELTDWEAGGLQAAQALLGETAQAADSASRFSALYTSDQGSCTVGLDGSFTADLQPIGLESHLQKNAQKLLEQMGFDVAELTDGPDGSLIAWQRLLGVRVFSDGLQLEYTGEELTAVRGMFFVGGQQIARISENACISCSDALVAFLSRRDALGWVGSSILQVEQGYRYAESASTTLRLTPVWRIDTDTGSFEVSGLSGDVTALAAAPTT